MVAELSGLVAAPHTPMRPDLTVDLEHIGAQAEFLGANGVSGAFVCGTTGEGVSLTLDERRSVVEAWRSAAPAGMPVIVNVSHSCLADILEATAPLAANLAGVKFTHEALDDLRRCLAWGGGRLNILFGRDEMLLAGLALGSPGGVGSTYNYAAPLYLRIMDAFARGDMDAARADQLRSAELVVLLRRFGGLAAGKAMMGLAGMDCGPPRLPLRDLGEDERREMREALERIGFFEWCCRAP
ncbi:MAG: dihydrodipicolinate synthase family protein [Planctomycetota bacterium]